MHSERVYPLLSVLGVSPLASLHCNVPSGGLFNRQSLSLIGLQRSGRALSLFDRVSAHLHLFASITSLLAGFHQPHTREWSKAKVSTPATDLDSQNPGSSSAVGYVQVKPGHTTNSVKSGKDQA